MNFTIPSNPDRPKSRLLSSLDYLFLLLVFSQSLQFPRLPMFGQNLMVSDLLFPVVFSLWLVCLAFRKTELRFHKIYWLFFLYILAMLFSLWGTADTGRSLTKLVGEIYLIGLAGLTFNLIRTAADLRRLIYVWLAGTSLVLLVSVVSILLFYFDPANPILESTLYHYGAVPLGQYPRINATLVSASMLCNYLLVSFFLLLIAAKLGWIRSQVFRIFGGILLVAAVFTISSGLGGFVLGIGLWCWFFAKKHNRIFLRGGILAALLFLPLNFIALHSYPNPPFIWRVPFSDQIILPSSRILVWNESLQTILENPLNGVGIGQNVCQVIFQNAEGTNSLLSDAHNIFLNVAGQTGLVGLAVFLLIIFFLLKEIRPFEKNVSPDKIIRFGLGSAFITAFIYQGFLGSFEDSRHLWILIGLILSFGLSRKGEK